MDKNLHLHLVDKKFPEITFEDIYKMQQKLQEAYGVATKPEDPLKVVYEKLNTQYHGLMDECREMFSALGGIESHGSSIWKNWKSKHEEAQNKKFSELTETELFELQLEYVDILKFVLNIGFLLQIDKERLCHLFNLKTYENYERIKHGY